MRTLPSPSMIGGTDEGTVVAGPGPVPPPARRPRPPIGDSDAVSARPSREAGRAHRVRSTDPLLPAEGHAQRAAVRPGAPGEVEHRGNRVSRAGIRQGPSDE